MPVPVGQNPIPELKRYLWPAYYEDFFLPPSGWETTNSTIKWYPLTEGALGIITVIGDLMRQSKISNPNLSLARSRIVGYRIRGGLEIPGKPTKIKPILIDSEGKRISGPFHGVSTRWKTYKHELKGRKIDRLEFIMSPGSSLDFDRIWITYIPERKNSSN